MRQAHWSRPLACKDSQSASGTADHTSAASARA
jgi:hypothetical protein